MKLQGQMNELKASGINVVAISYDSVDTLKEFAERAEVKFPLLADPESKTIDAYGIRNTDVDAGSRQDGIPHPGTFVLDSKGTVRAKLFYTIRVRHTPDELIETCNELRATTR